MDKDAILNRIRELISLSESVKGGKAIEQGSSLFLGAMGIFCLLYGEDSQQVKYILDLREKARAQALHMPDMELGETETTLEILARGIKGCLENLRTEVEVGLLRNLQNKFTGAVLSDFILLAREALSESGDGGKNVAAVLAAAAYEDTIRRMGSELAGISGRPNLLDVTIELKNKNILEGPQVVIAQGYLNFRNNALHADWDKIGKESIESILGFVEQLLLKHFI